MEDECEVILVGLNISGKYEYKLKLSIKSLSRYPVSQE